VGGGGDTYSTILTIRETFFVLQLRSKILGNTQIYELFRCYADHSIFHIGVDICEVTKHTPE
jgi:hypothetical protein